MSTREVKIQVGNSPVHDHHAEVDGELVQMEGEYFYRISNYDKMPAFFMTLVSPGDQWLFIASNGGMTAGRKNSQSSLFPYYTVDKLIDSTERTGAKSMFRVKRDGKTYLWEPFSGRYLGLYRVQRNLYKNKLANRIRFEEVNEDLKLKFSYEWSFSDRYGFVLHHELTNLGDEQEEVELISGIQNLLPSGVNPFLQNTQSTLVDAYRKNELDRESGLGIFSLSSIIVDRAEPSEALRANTVWCRGLDSGSHLLSIRQLNAFRRGFPVQQEEDLKATKGAFLCHSVQTLAAGEGKEWYLVADVDLSVSRVNDLRRELLDNNSIIEDLKKSMQRSADELWRLVAQADGAQSVEHHFTSGRHFSNVLYNIMRGGIFESGYQIELRDFKAYLKKQNRSLYQRREDFLTALPADLSYPALLKMAEEVQDADLQRLSMEYLPLSFSRRHGDPSRPWNQFHIEGPDDKGKHRISFEGNWRDIFQNWEALAYSFPHFITGMIAKFVNASTVDGYNPYRITKDGVDWEVEEPENPWSFIGYWGDHQIIYLLRLLEHCEKHFPGKLQAFLQQDIFTYANVPYRLKTFTEILDDPKDTINFDGELERKIKEKLPTLGSDARLWWKDDEPLRANLAEKLLLTGLVKFANLIPGGGIWMNTQRPEWNDANNALVGNGISMVTLFHLRRYFEFLKGIFKDQDLSVNSALSQFLRDISDACTRFEGSLKSGFDGRRRFEMLSSLGKISERYRQRAYAADLGDQQELSAVEVEQVLNSMLSFLDHSIASNKRADGLYHSYNLLSLNREEKQADIDRLYEMLEGQVAILNAGVLNAEESVKLLDNLKNSKLYRDDQYSYLLYPDRELPSFLQKNIVPRDFAGNSAFVQKLVEQDDHSLVEMDEEGNYHFSGDLRNAKVLKAQLKELSANGYQQEVAQEGERLLEVYEKVFNHKSFTGRSGTFFAYEGLGSIYWHMVSKLLLAVQETLYRAHRRGANQEWIGKLTDHYYEVRAGIGYNKGPELYGAFPTDAYSHTPKNSGARQPGMTGQVKEDIINRWAELGLWIEEGRLCFDPFFWNQDEFLKNDEQFRYLAKNGNAELTEVKADQIAFTYCGCLIRYQRGGSSGIRYKLSGQWQEESGVTLSRELSQMLFGRDLRLEEIELTVA